MKRIIPGIIVAAMVLTLSITALAAGTIAEKDGKEQIDVLAESVYISPENMYTEIISSGNTSITTNSGATVSVDTDGAALDELTLNVTEMLSSDKEAYSWISNVVNNQGGAFTAYDIFFTDKGGSRVAITEGTAVAITTPDGFSAARVYLVGSEGTKTAIASTQSGNKTLFSVPSSGYYVLTAESASGAENPESPENQPDSSAPPTGDTGKVILCIALLLVSAASLTVLGIIRKHRKSDRK